MFRGNASFFRLAGYSTQPVLLNEEEAKEMFTETALEMKYRGTQKALKEAICEVMKGRKAPSSPAGRVAKAIRDKCRHIGCTTYNLLLSDLSKAIIPGEPLARHLIVDEFQDSSWLDCEIYEKITRNASTSWFVGDPDQSIYGFRGSVPDVMRSQQKAEGVKTFHLDQTYRLTYQTARSAERLLESGGVEVNIKTIKSGDWPHLIVENTPEEEAAVIAAIAREEVANGRTVGVLARTNYEVDRLSRCLDAAAVTPYEPERLTEGWDRFITAFQFFVNPDNDYIAKRFTAIAEPKEYRKISAVAAGAGVSINTYHWNVTPMRNLRDALVAAERFGGAESYFLAEQSTAHCLTVDEAVAALHGVHRIDRAEDRAVSVLTAHSAKGLEFDCVIIAAANEGIFPQAKKDTDIDEERRLFYVAITRAKERVFFTRYQFAHDRFNPRKVVEHQPSRFIAETTKGGE